MIRGRNREVGVLGRRLVFGCQDVQERWSRDTFIGLLVLFLLVFHFGICLTFHRFTGSFREVGFGFGFEFEFDFEGLLATPAWFHRMHRCAMGWRW